MNLKEILEAHCSALEAKRREVEALMGVPVIAEPKGPPVLVGDEYVTEFVFRPETERDRFAGCGSPSCCGVAFDERLHYIGGDGLIYRRPRAVDRASEPKP